MTIDDRLTLNVSQVAKILGVSRNLAYEAIRRGDLPCIRVGAKRILVPRAALEKMLQGPTSTRSPQP
ncbi:MAG: helix-turn-helix domain-containing protein [Chloroflexi bacterium]|nr:helix-turn-helix domain-containing protein [Chloroflexota bacterium]